MKKRWTNVESFVLRQCVQLWSGLDTCVYNYAVASTPVYTTVKWFGYLCAQLWSGLDTCVYNCAVVWIPVCATVRGLDTRVRNAVRNCGLWSGLDTCVYNFEGFRYLCVQL